LFIVILSNCDANFKTCYNNWEEAQLVDSLWTDL
jgi:hypothetical protein